ncbi:DUF4268 domain-containing protein [Paracoccus sp. DMF-8]|uniref:DUF4268 domain-containing protein n=1 Tax=Paracoccus sp. DMF-8 TaxID=3019445 RepID=UPI0023E89347|nr:DUF4268 domain-containing protein [Paracoccus sp. DMF-8]MDF3605760.1 DUF4268 domain-containing protein [Paracoccus sp. DMF-8]
MDQRWVMAFSSCRYSLIFGKSEARVELVIERSDASENKRIFDTLCAEKAAIEAVFGEPLTWQRKDERKKCQVVFASPFDSFDPTNWPQMIAWMSEHIRKLEAAFKEPLARLNRQIRTHDEEGI